MKLSSTLLLALAGTLTPLIPAQAAVLISTGTTEDGRAYLTIPTMTFEIVRDVSASGFSALEFDIVDAWPTQGAFPDLSESGSGLTYTDSAHPGTFTLTDWIGHSLSYNSSSDYDSALIAPANTSYTYTVGDIITLEGGTFTLDTANASIPIFPSGSYSIYFAGLGGNGGILSNEGVAAVPEPNCLALTILALGGVVLWGGRRRMLVAATCFATACLAVQPAKAATPLNSSSKLLPVWSYEAGNNSYTCATGSITSVGTSVYRLRNSLGKTDWIAEIILETVAGPSLRIYCQRDESADMAKRFLGLAMAPPTSELTNLQKQADEASAEAQRPADARQGKITPDPAAA